MNKIKFNIDASTGYLSETDAKKYFSTIGFSVFALIVVQLIASVAIFLILVSMFAPWMFYNSITYSTINLIATYVIPLPVFVKMLSRLPAVKPLSSPLGVKGWWGAFCCAITMMVAGNYISQTLILWLETMMGAQQENPVAAMTENAPLWSSIIFVAIIPAIFEELVFRKILCAHLLPLGEGYTILLSAIIFALCHGNFFQIFYAFGIGLILALVYVKTGKLIHTILIHFMINFLAGVFFSWVLSKMDLEKLSEILEQMYTSAQINYEEFTPFVIPLMLLAIYEVFVYAATIIGIVLFIRSRKKISLDSGILPPPKEHKVANIFLNTGVAAAIASFAFVFILSLI